MQFLAELKYCFRVENTAKNVCIYLSRDITETYVNTYMQTKWNQQKISAMPIAV